MTDFTPYKVHNLTDNYNFWFDNKQTADVALIPHNTSITCGLERTFPFNSLDPSTQISDTDPTVFAQPISGVPYPFPPDVYTKYLSKCQAGTTGVSCSDCVVSRQNNNITDPFVYPYHYYQFSQHDDPTSPYYMYKNKNCVCFAETSQLPDCYGICGTGGYVFPRLHD